MPLLGIHDVKIRAAGVDPKLMKDFCEFLLSPVGVEIKDAGGDIGRERGNITDGESTTRGDFVELVGRESPSIMETRWLDMKSSLGKQAIRKKRRWQVFNQRFLANLFNYSAIALRICVGVTNAEANTAVLRWLEIEREIIVLRRIELYWW